MLSFEHAADTRKNSFGSRRQLHRRTATFRMAKHGRACSSPRCLIRNLCYTLLLPIDSLSVQGDKCASVNPGDAAKMSGRIRMASLKA